MTIIGGDFNAKVGERGDAESCMGRYGLGKRNEAGQQLIDFCEEQGLVIQNTCFQNHPRRLYTWTSPDGHTRNQIDYFLSSIRWRRTIKKCKTYPGADGDSDHQLLMAEWKLRLKKTKQIGHSIKFNLEENTMEYEVNVQNRFKELNSLEEQKCQKNYGKISKMQ